MKTGWFRSSVALKSGSVTLGEARQAARKAKATRRDSTAATKGGHLWDQYLGHFGSGVAKKKAVAKKGDVAKKATKYSVRKSSPRKAAARKK